MAVLAPIGLLVLIVFIVLLLLPVKMCPKDFVKPPLLLTWFAIITTAFAFCGVVHPSVRLWPLGPKVAMEFIGIGVTFIISVLPPVCMAMPPQISRLLCVKCFRMLTALFVFATLFSPRWLVLLGACIDRLDPTGSKCSLRHRVPASGASSSQILDPMEFLIEMHAWFLRRVGGTSRPPASSWSHLARLF